MHSFNHTRAQQLRAAKVEFELAAVVAMCCNVLCCNGIAMVLQCFAMFCNGSGEAYVTKALGK